MDAAFIWNLSKLGRIGSRRLQFDDDFADRLNYQYTSVLLFLFIGLIGVRQYVGKPIQCWIPQEFTRGWEEYAENYCWVANTYFAPIENRLPPVPDRRELLLVYYQWAPIVMAAQALLFYLPCLTWRLGMAHSGFNLHRVLQMAAEANEMIPEATEKTVKILSHYLRNCIQRQRMYKFCSQTQRVGVYNRLENEKADLVQGVEENCESNPAWTQTCSPVPTAMTNDDSKCTPNETDTKTIPYSETVDQAEAKHLLNHPTNHTMRDSTQHDPTDSNLALELMNTQLNRSSLSSVTSTNSITSADILAKARGRKPAPPPPPVNSGAANGAASGMAAAGGIQNLNPALETGQTKSADNVDAQRCGRTELPTQSNGSKLSQQTTDSKQIKIDSNKKTKPTSSMIGLGLCPIEPACGKDKGNFLVTLYMLVKLGYLSNVIGQIYLMQSFIGTKYTLYGAQVLIDLIRGQEWHHSGHFPRVTFCDLEAKKLGKNHVYTLQCVLPLNMFLEKIYIFLWFWHVVIAFITFVSLIIWIYRLFWPTSRFKLIDSYLKMLGIIPLKSNAHHQKVVEEFINVYLGLDGYFVIRLITTNCGALLASELTAEMWRSFQGLSKSKFIRMIRSHPQCACPNCARLNKPSSKLETELDSDPEAAHVHHDSGDRSTMYPQTFMHHGSMHPYFWMPTRKKHSDGSGQTHRTGKSHHRSRIPSGIESDLIGQPCKFRESLANQHQQQQQLGNVDLGSLCQQLTQQPGLSSSQAIPTSFQHKQNYMRPNSGRLNSSSDDIV